MQFVLTSVIRYVSMQQFPGHFISIVILFSTGKGNRRFYYAFKNFLLFGAAKDFMQWNVFLPRVRLKKMVSNLLGLILLSTKTVENPFTSKWKLWNMLTQTEKRKLSSLGNRFHIKFSQLTIPTKSSMLSRGNKNIFQYSPSGGTHFLTLPLKWNPVGALFATWVFFQCLVVPPEIRTRD